MGCGSRTCSQHSAIRLYKSLTSHQRINCRMTPGQCQLFSSSLDALKIIFVRGFRTAHKDVDSSELRWYSNAEYVTICWYYRSIPLATHQSSSCLVASTNSSSISFTASCSSFQAFTSPVYSGNIKSDD
jgi:hypothetical protein